MEKLGEARAEGRGPPGRPLECQILPFLHLLLLLLLLLLLHPLLQVLPSKVILRNLMFFNQFCLECPWWNMIWNLYDWVDFQIWILWQLNQQTLLAFMSFKMFSNDGRSYKIVNFLCVSSSDKKVLKLNQGDQNVKYCIPPPLSSPRG